MPLDPGPIEPFLADVKTRVDRHLTRFFEQKREHAQSLSEPSKELVEAVFDFTMRGGAAGAAIWQTQAMSEQMADELRLPLVRLVDGTGGGG